MMSMEELERKVNELNELVDKAGELREEILSYLEEEYLYDPGEEGEDYGFFECSEPVYGINIELVKELIDNSMEKEREE